MKVIKGIFEIIATVIVVGGVLLIPILLTTGLLVGLVLFWLKLFGIL